MYIQEQGAIPFALPKGYSGNAFQERDTQTAAVPPPPPDTDVPPAPAEHREPPKEEPPSAPAGLFGKMPFLSSLLPPPRRKKEGDGLPEWAIVALILFVLSDEREGNLLPILLLLLLWD